MSDVPMALYVLSLIVACAISFSAGKTQGRAAGRREGRIMGRVEAFLERERGTIQRSQ
jgi:hypothetical protein